jgi:1-acyl-sn-glycerol-3-phosphate acyltransferase
MLASLGRTWRIFATGLCFLLYGSLSLLASLTLLPLMLLWPGDHAARERRIRLFVSSTFRLLLGIVQILGIGSIEVEGREWLVQSQGKLVVATHPMYLDVLALLMLMPYADCVVKSAMLKNPFYRRFAQAAGYISNGDSALLVDACVDSLKRGRTLVLFPEGTRSVPGQPLHLRRGAAQVAVRSGCRILPVTIHCDPPALTKGFAWWRAPERPWRLSLRFHPPVDLSAFGARAGLPNGIAARDVTRGLEDFFKQQLANHERTDRRTEAAHHRLARS